MQPTRFLSLALAFLSLSQSTLPQNSASAPSQGVSLLQQSLFALSPSGTATDVTFSGTARRIAGSEDETGTVVLKALVSGASRVDLALPSGPRCEILNNTVAPPVGSWSGPDGVSHPIPFHNLLSESAWFLPAFAIARRLSASGYVASYIGHETHNGQAVEHISVSQSSLFPNPPDGVSSAHLTEVDFFLDSITFLPAAISFNTHPNNDLLVDIPMEVRFSDYRLIGGAQVPYRVQKFVNNGLILDLRFQTVLLNTGLASADFQVR